VNIEAIRQPKAKLQDTTPIKSDVPVKATKEFGMKLPIN
jgi:hypothetical protein